MKRLATILALGSLVALAACTPAEEEAAERDVDSVRTAMADQSAEFRMAVEARLAEVDDSIDSLRVEAEAAGDDASAEIEGTIAELREERDSLQRDLDQLERSTEAGYDDLRADVERRIRELEVNVEEAYADIRDGNGDDQGSS